MKLYYRLQQQVYRMASYFVKWHTPHIIQGRNVYNELLMSLSNYNSILIVTDASILKLGLLNDMLKVFNDNHKHYTLYSNVNPNPTINNVEEALLISKKNKCDAVIAFGGGSPMDCGKIVSARMSNPNLPVIKMKGLQKVRKRNIPLYLLPTTSGTGSETTIAAVITDDSTHEKYSISDMCLIPDYTIFVPELTCKMPPIITATTGMDALTHAVEAYIGNSNTKQTKIDALNATKLIHDNLLVAYTSGDNIEARIAMQYASFYAGRAFTRAYVGNVHAIAHTLGGMYNIPHGLANAVALPIVLDKYGSKTYRQLAEIADYIKICNKDDSTKVKAEKFILWVKGINRKMNIPQNIKEIKEEDIAIMAKRAYKEANPFYPVPEIWSIDKFSIVLNEMKGV